VLLWKNRDNIRVEKDCTVDAKEKERTLVTFLHHPYSGDHFWWEAVDLVPRYVLQHAYRLECAHYLIICVVHQPADAPCFVGGVPALIELPTARLLAALSISVVFLVVQNERKPYATAEHNALASLTAAQISADITLHLYPIYRVRSTDSGKT
jgi:hypothetical protein